MILRLASLGSYLREVRQELKGVQWPTRAATVRFTLLVVLVSLAVAVGTGIFDFFLSFLVDRFLLR